MFNRTPFPFTFNRSKYNDVDDKTISVHMSAISSMYSKVKESNNTLFNQTGFNRAFVSSYKAFDYNADMTIHSDIHGIATLTTEYERGIPYHTHMSGIVSVDANYVRERLFNANMHGVANVYANANRYTIKMLEFTGDLLPGDMIVIDMDRMTVTKNSENALKYFEGDFFELAPEWNEIAYKDNEQSRNVVLVTRYKDRWL